MSMCPAITKRLKTQSYLESTVQSKFAKDSLKLVIVTSIIYVTTDNYVYYFSDYEPESCLFLNCFHRADFFLMFNFSSTVSLDTALDSELCLAFLSETG